MFQTWEKAIELCKELAEQYQSYLYDYMKLANILVCIYIVQGPVVRRPVSANPEILTRVSFSFVKKNFPRLFPQFFLGHPVINL